MWQKMVRLHYSGHATSIVTRYLQCRGSRSWFIRTRAGGRLNSSQEDDFLLRSIKCPTTIMNIVTCYCGSHVFSSPCIVLKCPGPTGRNRAWKINRFVNTGINPGEAIDLSAVQYEWFVDSFLMLMKWLKHTIRSRPICKIIENISQRRAWRIQVHVFAGISQVRMAVYIIISQFLSTSRFAAAQTIWYLFCDLAI
jgi:hypothetical protein